MQNDPDMFKLQEQCFELPPLITSGYTERLNEPPEEIDDSKPLEISKTCEALTKFLTSQGLPLEAIQDTMFQNLFYSLDSSKTIPTPEILKTYMEKMGNPKALSKVTGPLSVTIDVIEKENGDNYLAFSIHFFEGFEERKCLINLKKLLITKIEAESILTGVRRAINILNYNQVKISYFVVPNEQMFEMFQPYNDVINNQFISFHHLIEKFAKNILEIEVFSKGIEQLRAFVLYIKTTPSAYTRFRKYQLAAYENIYVPDLDDQNCWFSTTIFIFKCLNLHRRFSILAERCNVSYISTETFSELSLLYQLLQFCIKHARDLSGEHNSISQVIPAVMSIRTYMLVHLSHGHSFESDIQKAFSNAFRELTFGKMRKEYELATLLDPRFAYDPNIYPILRWSAIEKDVKGEIVENSDFQSKKYRLMFTREARIQKVLRELADYRRLRIISRPKANESPFEWWNSQKDNLENLVLIAREYLACPAVSIDAQQFFGSGGKFSNLVEIYDSEKLESYLNCAGHYQQFLGHGSNIEHISEREIAFKKLLIDAERQRIIWGLSDPNSTNVNQKELSLSEEKKKKKRYSDILPSSSNKIPEIMPEDVKLEPMDLGNTVEDPKDQHNYHKSIGASRKKWALGQPMIVLKAVKLPGITVEFSKKMKPSSDKDSIEKEVKPVPLGLEERKEPSKYPIVPIQKEIKPLDDYALEDVKLEFEEKDPVEIKLEQMDYPYTLIEKEHNYQKATAATEHIKPEELFDDNDEPMEIKPDLEELNLSGGGNFEPLDDNYGLKKPLYFPRKHFKNRKCTLCEKICPLESFRNVKNVNEKLFLLLGGILGNRFDASQAVIKYFRKRRLYYCRNHFQESCIEIFNELGVERPENIMDCEEAQFENILKLFLLIQNMPAEFESTQMLLASMTEKYYNRPEAIAQDEEQEAFEKYMKKRFEKRKAKCCFCLKSMVTSKMTSAPQSYEQRQKWIGILGKEFGRRLKLNKNQLLCKSHFSPDAFDENGRRRRGVLPEFGFEESQVTHRINGDNFLKIEEPEEVDARTSSQRIDDRGVTGETSEDVAASKPPGRPCGRPTKKSRLEVRRSPYEKLESLESSEDVNYYEQLEYSDFSEDDGPDHTEYTPEDYDNIKSSSRPERRARKYQKIVKEDVEKDSEGEQICRFCFEFVNKTEAFNWNKNWIRLSDWNKSLGEELFGNLDFRDNNYVCKKHFRKGSL